MCGLRMEQDKGEAPSSSQRNIIHEFREEDHLLGLHQQADQEHQQREPHHQQPPRPLAPPPHPTAMQYNLTGGGYGGGGSAGGCEGFVFPPEPAASVLPWSFPQAHPINPAHFSASTSTIAAANNSLNHINMVRSDHNPFVGSLPTPAPPPLPPLTYGDLYARRASPALQFGYDYGGVPLCADPLGLAGLYVGGPEALIRGGGMGTGLSMAAASSPFAGLGSEFGKMSAQEIMDAKALAASKSHSEAERRRRERINAHLAKLRSLLPSTTKTDKASLLAEVIQHVKELKRQTSEIAEESPVPSESDELSVEAASDEDGRLVVRASICCEDRTDLLPDLIKALKSLKLRALKAEITTLAGRVRNVLVITGEDEDDGGAGSGGSSDHATPLQPSIASIQEALKAVMERVPATDEASAAATAAGGGGGGGSSSAGGIKRQRTTSLSSILEHRSI